MALGWPVVQVFQVTPPETSGATLATLSGTSTPGETIRAWAFPDSAGTYLDYLCALKGYNGHGLKIQLVWTSTATSGTCVWQAAIRRVPDDAEDLDTTAFTYDFNTVNGTPAGTAGEVSYDTVDFVDGTDMDGLADGEMFILRIYRNPADSSDTLGATANLVGFVAYEAATSNCIEIATTDNHAAIIAANPGAILCLQAGIHRTTMPLTDGQTLRGDSGAILSGAALVTSWTHSGSVWIATVISSAGAPAGQCADGTNLCTFNEDCYFDDVRQTRVATQGAVTAGKYHYASSTLTVGTDPTGHTVELSVRPYAINSADDHITVEDLIIEKFCSQAQIGAVHLEGSHNTLNNCEVRFCHGIGVQFWGSDNTMTDGSVHHNGQMGVSAKFSNQTFDGVEIHHNNVAGFDSGWEAGAMKHVVTNNCIMRNCYVHDNTGPGIWYDIDNINGLIEDNIVEDNSESGIFWEISYSAIIRRNQCRRNGAGFHAWVFGGGITIAGSGGTGIEIYENTLVDNYQGIMLVQQNRGTGAFGPHIVQNVNVHDNTNDSSVSGAYYAGGATDNGDNGVFTRNNTWTHNSYVGSTNGSFAWNNAGGRTFANWQSLGNDTTGTGP